MNHLQCSPKNIHNKISCFSDESLLKIANKFNEEYPDDKIQIPTNIDRESFWKELIGKINDKTGCDNDICLIEQPFIRKIKDKELHSSLRPIKPKEWIKSPSMWLSTTDINNVLQQYEEKHMDFKYIGAVPIDFDKEFIMGMCVSDELCKLNLKNLYMNGIRKLGIVFNLDPHDKPGSHWVSMFTDMTNGGIYFFDSYGHEPPVEVCKLMEKIRLQGNSLIDQGIITYSTINNEHETYTKCKIENKQLIVDRSVDILMDTPIFLLDSNNKCVQQINVINVSKHNMKILHLDKKINNDKEIRFISQKGFRKFYNNIRFQYGGSECGVYSIFFQTQLLNGKRFIDVISNIISDHTINNHRNYYYRTNDVK